MLTGRGTSQRLSHAAQIDNDSLDTVTLAFDLRLETLHFVAVEGVGDIPADIDSSHCCGKVLYDGFTREKRLELVWGRSKVEVGRQRHAVEAISSNFAADLCAESWVRQMASRWCSGNYCTVSAFCEMFAAWAAGRVGKRDFGANTYTANVR